MEGHIITFNPFLEKLSGYRLDEVQGKDWFSTFLPEQNHDPIGALFKTALSGNETHGNINPIIAKDGHEIIVEWYDKTLDDTDGNTIALLAIGHDITFRKQTEDALQKAHDELEIRVEKRTDELLAIHDQNIRSERLAATGQLAASIAHEINSPLQAVTVMLGMLKNKYMGDKKLIENLNLLTGAFCSIRDTVKNLLDLNRPGKERLQRINVNSIIKKTVALVESQLKKNKVEINLDLSGRVPDILASPQQLNHIFLNLINNAIEAISGESKPKDGWINRTSSDRGINIKTNLRKGNVVIKVSDTGPGISKKDLNHIFDPFYTRKKKMGMGVGLSICHGFIEDYGGTIIAENSPDGGAVFTITLPC